MSHVKLAEMDAADMLDVLHYIYEEDMNFSTRDQQEMADNRRVAIWNSFYKSPYKYALNKSGIGNNFDPSENEIDFTPFNPASGGGKVKPYFPPTDFSGDDEDPFGGVLDSPIGG